VLTSPIVFAFASIAIAIAGRRVVVNGKRGVVSIMDYGSIGDGTNVLRAASCKMVTMTHTHVLTAWELIQR
jgi:hypothetical protein